jgi:hypothetical protein
LQYQHYYHYDNQWSLIGICLVKDGTDTTHSGSKLLVAAKALLRTHRVAAGSNTEAISHDDDDVAANSDGYCC